MYKYVYRRIKNSLNGWGLISGNVYGNDEHQEIINEMAKKGYRYVGFIPVKQRGTGHIEAMDLVFEKEINKEV